MILLDTHAWLWLALEPKKLSRAATQAIRQSAKGSGLAVASISLLEVAFLFANGRVRSRGTVSQAVQELVTETRVDVLELTPEIAATAVQLSDAVPKDPADRLIVATALVHALPLVTRDARILESEACRAIW